MNLIEFVKQCKKIDKALNDEWEVKVGTIGMCLHVNRMSRIAMESFTKKFKPVSPHPVRPYWLGSPYSEEGYKNRKKYLRKFLWWSILTLKFLRY